MVFWTGDKTVKLFVIIFIATVIALLISDGTTPVFEYKSVSLTIDELAIIFTIFAAILACWDLWKGIKQEEKIKIQTAEHIDNLFLSCKKISFYYECTQKNLKHFEDFKEKLSEEVTFESYVTNSFELIIMDFAYKFATYFLNQTKVTPNTSISSENALDFIQYLILVNSNQGSVTNFL